MNQKGKRCAIRHVLAPKGWALAADLCWRRVVDGEKGLRAPGERAGAMAEGWRGAAGRRCVPEKPCGSWLQRGCCRDAAGLQRGCCAGAPGREGGLVKQQKSRTVAPNSSDCCGGLGECEWKMTKAMQDCARVIASCKIEGTSLFWARKSWRSCLGCLRVTSPAPQPVLIHLNHDASKNRGVPLHGAPPSIRWPSRASRQHVRRWRFFAECWWGDGCSVHRN